MKTKVTVDFQAERAVLLAAFRNPAHVESVLARQGITARRMTAEKTDDTGLAWHCSVIWRGQARDFDLTLQETVTHETFVLACTSTLADVTIAFDFYDMPDHASRIVANLQVVSRSVMVSLALQSLRLIPGRAQNQLRRLTQALGGGPHIAA